jgi:FkbM family methyltransferase
MQVSNFDIGIDFDRVGPVWHKGWHKSWRMNSVYGLESSGRKVEIDCFLSILKDIDKPSINFIELGSAWGEWGITLAGVIRTKLIDSNILNFNYLAVEGEKYYSELAQEHIDYNRIPGEVYNYAISDKEGYCYFNRFSGNKTFFDTWCTQGVTFDGNIGGSKLKTWALALYHLVTGRLAKVEMHTLDTIVYKWGYYPDIIHMDIEGLEARVLKSTTISPQYWLIGTHSKELNKEVSTILSKDYNCIVDQMPCRERLKGLNQDGLQLWRKK